MVRLTGRPDMTLDVYRGRKTTIQPTNHLAVACGVYGDFFFVMSFFPRDVLDEILNLIESVSEDFPSYSLVYVRFVFRLKE